MLLDERDLDEIYDRESDCQDIDYSYGWDMDMPMDKYTDKQII